jgi:hypothetical protein
MKRGSVLEINNLKFLNKYLKHILFQKIHKNPLYQKIFNIACDLAG